VHNSKISLHKRFQQGAIALLQSIAFSLSANAAEFNPVPPPSPPIPQPFPGRIPGLQIPPEKPLNLPSPSPTPPTTPETVSESLHVSAFEFTENTVFSSEELGEIIIILDRETISIASIQERNLTFAQLLQIASAVADFYAQKGYRTSGAKIIIPQETEEQGKGIVKIKVIEGTLEQITVGVLESDRSGRLKHYIKARLGVKLTKPLNVDRLLESLQLLQRDPLITNISATLSPGTAQGKSILEVKYKAADSFKITAIADNSRPPSVGSFQRGVNLTEANVFGLGDSFSIGYLNTDGSDRFDISYELPFNAQNGSLRFQYTNSESDVIEPPFDDIDRDGKSPDITSNYEAYELTLRQPIIR
jgi:hemolysin activation/secretion protein